jgi:hypothetical protein
MSFVVRPLRLLLPSNFLALVNYTDSGCQHPVDFYALPSGFCDSGHQYIYPHEYWYFNPNNSYSNSYDDHSSTSHGDYYSTNNDDRGGGDVFHDDGATFEIPSSHDDDGHTCTQGTLFYSSPDYSSCNEQKRMFQAEDESTPIPSSAPTTTSGLTSSPSRSPSLRPTAKPSFIPSRIPTNAPSTQKPIASVKPTAQPTLGTIVLEGQITLSHFDLSTLSSDDTQHLIHATKSSLADLLDIEESYIKVTVEEGKRRNRRRLLSSINNSNKNELLKQLLFHHHSTDHVSLSDASAQIQFQITALHSYLTHQLNISSSITTVTVDKITQSIASEINSNSGATFMSHLEQYVDQYGGALIKAALENSHYETCSVSESSSSSDSDSSSRDRENVFSATFYQVTGNLIARIVVGIVGGIAILAMGIRCVVVRRRQNKNDREETTDSNTKNSNIKKKPGLVRVVPIENHDNSPEEGNSHGINNSNTKTGYGNSKSSKFPDQMPITNDEAVF